MKSRFAFFLLAVLSVPILGLQMAQAQSDETLRCDVPFDFYAGAQKLPAGTYYVKFDMGSSNVQISDESSHAMFVVRNDFDDSKSSSPALVFDHVGDNYFLKIIETRDGDVNFAVKNAEQRLALNTSPTPVVVAANLR